VTVGILPQILAMAATLHLDVIVEGIETRQQARYFAGADRSILAQGWLFGRPVPAEAFRGLRAEDAKRTVASAETPEESASAMPFQVA
jgi:sensor c-di-GMP phosphodiesterase-like protein